MSKRNYYTKENLLKRPLYFTFKCHCQYCKKLINTYILSKELFINDIAYIILNLMYYHDIFMYQKNEMSHDMFTKMINDFNSQMQEYRKLKTEVQSLIYIQTNVQNKYSFFNDNDNIFNLPQDIVNNTLIKINTLQENIDDCELMVNKYYNKSKKIRNKLNMIRNIFDAHDKKFHLKNLNLYAIYSPEHLDILEKYASFNLATQLLGDQDGLKKNWQTFLASRCCTKCHYFGHKASVCRNIK
jgi:hypothetical protein